MNFFSGSHIFEFGKLSQIIEKWHRKKLENKDNMKNNKKRKY